ncbi:hypothetical protein KP806_19215 [Paenibacillus sp. N4]|nr:hypothetical protein [Paenibacillus vietnamensis]
MWKTAKVLFCMVLLLIVTVQPLAAAGKTVKLKVTFVSAKLVENNHVGNEWWSGAYVNGKELKAGGSLVLTLKPADSVKLKAKVSEQDKYPDNGEANVSVKASSVIKSMNKSLSVTVTENRGRYSGETATWSFSFKIEKVK